MTTKSPSVSVRSSVGDGADSYGQHSVVPPLPPRYRFRDLLLGDHQGLDEDRSRTKRLLNRFFSDDGEEENYERVRVEFFTNEKSFKERLQLYFIKNQRSSLRIRIFNLFIKLLSCVLYIVRVSLDDPSNQRCYNIPFTSCKNITYRLDEIDYAQDSKIHWELVLWVNRNQWLWGIQVSVAIISLAETLLLTYLGYKGNILQQILSFGFILELVNTVPFVMTIFYKPLRYLFLPVFLNCWLAKSALENMLNDLHRAMQKTQSALAQQLMILSATIGCLIFTSVCGIQHLQRAGNQYFGLFDSLWFVIVTFSTVGYGDVCPDIWPSKLFMMVLIGTVFIVLPTQFEQLAYTWMQRQKQGGTYSSHRAQNEKHVVVVATTLHADSVMDFLNEFYAQPKLQDYFVVLVSPNELDMMMQSILQVPIWAARVIYLQGSVLKDGDLSRCRMQDAEACFMIADRCFLDRTAADQHTILRSWAVKDFAPYCPQYVQIFRPENKFHVKFAEHVVCEDEFKYALLANNCLCPGTSTLVTLLLHTSRGAEGQTESLEWMKLYGKRSGNEIYHIKLGDSQFFGEYEGKSFTYASFHAHRKYGVSLVGIQQEIAGSTIQLNPGPRHLMQASDVCFYMNITKEENSAFILAHPNQEKDSRASLKGKSPSASYNKIAGQLTSIGTIAVDMKAGNNASGNSIGSNNKNNQSGSNLLELPSGMSMSHLQKRPSIAPVPAMIDACNVDITIESDTDSEAEPEQEDLSGHMKDIGRGWPYVMPYIGTSPTMCYMARTKRPHCCLQLNKVCSHCNYCHAREYNWPNRAIIVAADYASNGLYNFIVPLRSHARPKHTLNPIVLLLEKPPDESFLETICYFPMVYWMIGSIDQLDHLLCAGINLADNVVIVNKESSNSLEEDTLADCNTIVAVQTIFRLFPNANIITELSQASNMRFMQFRAKDHYSLQLSKLERKEKDRGSHLYYMFRMPFAAGYVFSASMLDTLLYQAFVKGYLITFVRLLLGIDQALGSGHLSCMKITQEELWIRTYGRLYQKLCSTSCEIPIGIYRTQTQESDDNEHPSRHHHHHQRHHTTKSSRCSTNSHTHCVACSPTRSPYLHRVYYGPHGPRAPPTRGGNSPSQADERPPPPSAIEQQEISQMVRCRMSSLGHPDSDYDDKVNTKSSTISYVIINPGYDLKLQLDDIIYLIRPPSLSPQQSPLLTTRHMKREEPTGAERNDKFGKKEAASSSEDEESDDANRVTIEIKPPAPDSPVPGVGVGGTMV